MRIVVQASPTNIRNRLMYKSDGRYYCETCVSPVSKVSAQQLSKVAVVCCKCESHVVTAKPQKERRRRF